MDNRPDLDLDFSYARRVSRAFSFQDTPNKIKKTISSVFRSPFQSSYSQQSLNEQKASKLTSLASLQLTPTLIETKRKFINIQKSAMPLISPPKSGGQAQSQKRSNHPMHLLSTRTLRNLRSTTTSTINGIAAAMSTSMSSASSSSSSSCQSAAKMSHYYSSVKHINKSNSANGDLSENCAESKQCKSDDEVDEVDVDDADEDTENYAEDHHQPSVKIGQQMKRTSEDYDRQSVNGDAENENPSGPEFYKQQLAQNKSKKQLLMSNTSREFANVSNKIAGVKRVDTL